MRKRIAVFASGNGTNLQALIDYLDGHDINSEIAMVFSDKQGSKALKRAKKHGIKTYSFSPGEYGSRKSYDEKILSLLKEEKIDLVVLAGYMLIVGKDIVEEFRNRVINIHPALLPCFKGMHAIEDAFNKGVKITGVTVHFVDEDMDNGPIIAQSPVFIDDHDSIETLEEKIHSVEHKLYPKVVELFCYGRLRVVGGKVRLAD